MTTSLTEDLLSTLPSMRWLIHNIGDLKHPNYTSRAKILASDGLFAIDGIYQTIYDNKDVLKDKKCILFIIGNWVGKDNSLDVGVPHEKMCTWEQLLELKIKMGMELGWHTWSHPNLRRLSYQEIIKEITPPTILGPVKYFAYPHGKFNEMILKAVEEVGYQYAFGVNRGDNSKFQLLRKRL